MRRLSADPVRRRSVLVAALALAALYLFRARLHAPRAERTDAVAARVMEMRERNRRAEAATELGGGGLGERLGRYERYVARLETLIPGSGEVPQLLEAVSREERRAGVAMTVMRPQPRVSGEFYEQWSYEIAVQGGYHAVGAFLSRVASLERIVVPDNLVVASLPGSEADGKVLATLEIRTYVFAAAAPEADDATEGAPRGTRPGGAGHAPSVPRPTPPPAPTMSLSSALSAGHAPKALPLARAVAVACCSPNRPAPQEDAPPPLVFEREVFRYPATGRRNPFAVPGGAQPTETARGTLRLLGVVASDDPRLGLALLARAPVTGAAPPTRPLRLRVGERHGLVRLLDAAWNGVLVEIGGPRGPVVQTLPAPRPRPRFPR